MSASDVTMMIGMSAVTQIVANTRAGLDAVTSGITMSSNRMSTVDTSPAWIT